MISNTSNLEELYAYNAWANAQVFSVCGDLEPSQLEEQAPGTLGTVLETLKHMVGVEDSYLYMLRDQPPTGGGTREEYFVHDLDWFRNRSKQLGEGYGQLVAEADATFMAQPLKVPWFDFELSKRDGLLQVLIHSTQHRAQIFSALGSRGVEVPNLDYIMFVGLRAGYTPD
ncbi:MAG: DinB family protein [Ktedonobacterales bacterium]